MPQKRGRQRKNPRDARRGRREERLVQNDLGQLSFEEVESEAPPPQRDSIARNYTPAIKFDSVKVMVVCTSGDNVPLAEISSFETIIGKIDTVEQVLGVLKNRVRICNALLRCHNINAQTDVKGTFISFTDAAGYRHRRPYINKYDGDFGIWAGEVEGGDLASHPSCQCGQCSGVHGPAVEILMEDESVEINPLDELD